MITEYLWIIANTISFYSNNLEVMKYEIKSKSYVKAPINNLWPSNQMDVDEAEAGEHGKISDPN